MRRYLAQLAISMRPGSVALIDTTLRHLAGYLTAYHPDVTAAAQIGRTHIEGFKAWLASTARLPGQPQPGQDHDRDAAGAPSRLLRPDHRMGL